MQHDAPTPPPFEEGLPQELWFSVDVECSGQTPLDGSLCRTVASSSPDTARISRCMPLRTTPWRSTSWCGAS